MEKVLKSGKFSTLANELASLLSNSVKASTLDVVTKEYPDLDKSKFGYEVVSQADLLGSYAGIVMKYVGAFPVVDALVSSTSPLTAEVVRACAIDEDPTSTKRVKSQRLMPRMNPRWRRLLRCSRWRKDGEEMVPGTSEADKVREGRDAGGVS